jgi:uncharacterized protein (DUF1800 family)
MASPQPLTVAQALARFGLGARPGDLDRAGADVRAALLAELERPEAGLLADPALSSSQAALQAHYAAQDTRQQARGAALPADAMVMGPERPMAPAAPPRVEQALFDAEAQARFARLATTDTPLLERLVMFWSNHFAVAVAKNQQVRACAGAFEREAIRPHVLGRFSDMLEAAESHPAMLSYLDNQQSVGPASKAGVNRGAGLNENLAREILELHTLGADGGYSQADVTSLAKVITGWIFSGANGRLAEPGAFVFDPGRHEPGPQRVLDRDYPQAGIGQGEAVLLALAEHPATARHIARKLARHFVADDPPERLVTRLAVTFIESGGDLRAVTTVLLRAPESWETPPGKLRTPQEFVAAALRATGEPPRAPQILAGLAAMGQPLWNPPGPNGYADTVAAWASPEGLTARLDVAAQAGRHWTAPMPPLALATAVLGPALSEPTRLALTRAESAAQAVALLLMSPEVQRR